MDMDMTKYELVIDLFGEGGGASGGGAVSAASSGNHGTGEGMTGGAEGAAATEGAQQQSSAPIDRDAEFEQMIKGDWKEAYEKRMKAQLDRRFKESDKLKKQAEGSRALMELLAGKYGVSADDADALLKAAEADESYYEAEAAEKGLTVEQLKHIKQLERENAALKSAREEREKQERNSQLHARWLQETEEAKKVYPGLDFAKEAQNERFSKMLAMGFTVKDAYESAHIEEIMSGSMQYAAKRAQQQTMDNIRARGMRPQEGGLGSTPAGSAKFDVNKLTKEQRAEYARKALRGERISFNE